MTTARALIGYARRRAVERDVVAGWGSADMAPGGSPARRRGGARGIVSDGVGEVDRRSPRREQLTVSGGRPGAA
ncbi:MAG: hypothetical protein CVU56_15660 [Deltaproteobacteria bacterium HGW-Deltaproteobacteria-14]|nr:MAG: hypothetical protein CVU56_15660 [Deltaproteobacteria bacterium HGW-Deltaproteobacteria-14]